ncbi:unnamed protein product [Rangifer tarandus platyrhynchus]|uniref:Uncharacterized protein n=2 Tax=Rangifer tarandus platyrhynchus TaxID=3082113 RepID=A0ACB0ELK4_RANTA|nr:unnamed protein product [Rangifer tarandus platyrhynchus]CAI9701612.1 unnamed protein product [Rangifer tarandus platyrhynchus]
MTRGRAWRPATGLRPRCRQVSLAGALGPRAPRRLPQPRPAGSHPEAGRASPFERARRAWLHRPPPHVSSDSNHDSAITASAAWTGRFVPRIWLHLHGSRGERKAAEGKVSGGVRGSGHTRDSHHRAGRAPVPEEEKIGPGQ